MERERVLWVVMVVCVLAVGSFASAELIRGVDIDFVTIGNPGNAADTVTQDWGEPLHCGAVDYEFRMGKYEITNAQWNAFVNLAGAPTGNDPYAYDSSAYFTGLQQPTNEVSWYEAAQFCNYLTSGNKLQGAYLFQDGWFTGIDRAAAQTAYGTIYVIPTEDEWYKAAYHKNDGVTGNYWLYPTRSNSTPSNDLIHPDPGNNANFYQNGYTIGSPDYLTNVGEFENSASAYGTFDQGGNVWEWNETAFGSNRGLRGGSSFYSGIYDPRSSIRYYSGPNYENVTIGFRVASVPEPCGLALLLVGGLILRGRKQ